MGTRDAPLHPRPQHADARYGPAPVEPAKKSERHRSATKWRPGPHPAATPMAAAPRRTAERGETRPPAAGRPLHRRELPAPPALPLPPRPRRGAPRGGPALPRVGHQPGLRVSVRAEPGGRSGQAALGWRAAPVLPARRSAADCGAGLPLRCEMEAAPRVTAAPLTPARRGDWRRRRPRPFPRESRSGGEGEPRAGPVRGSAAGLAALSARPESQRPRPACGGAWGRAPVAARSPVPGHS